MRGKIKPAYLGFLIRGKGNSSSSTEAVKRAHAHPIVDVSDIGTETILETLKARGVKDVKISPEQFMGPEMKDLSGKTGIENIFVEFHPAASAVMPDDFIGRLQDISKECACIPVSSDLEFLISLVRMKNPPVAIGLKGSEASGIVSTETTGILFSTLKSLREETSARPAFIIWGGIFTPEASAAFLCSGVEGIVFESLHWLTDTMPLDGGMRQRLARLRPEHTTVVGLGLGVPVRVFDKGNSKAAGEIREKASSMVTVSSKERARKFTDYFFSKAIHPLDSSLANNELIPLGPEAAFAKAFTERFGESTWKAIVSFSEEIFRICDKAKKIKKGFTDSKLSVKLGTRYPIIQGAMSWISDSPAFALAVAKAGALPTFALGLKGAEEAEQELKETKRVLDGLPYAVNVITLSENPFHQEQLQLIEKIRPPFVVIAAGEPSHAVQLLEKGIEVIYVAPDPGLLKMALEAGVRYIILEGNEAGGHVGEFSALTLHQMTSEMKRRHPSLFENGFTVYTSRCKTGLY